MDYASLFKTYGFRVEQKNNGIQLVIHAQKKTIDFWPTTSKFFIREDKFRGESFEELKRHLNLTEEVERELVKKQAKKEKENKKQRKLNKAPTKVINDDIDLCSYCPEPSDIGAHGVEKGKVYSRHYCHRCFSLIHKGKGE
jgi:hypothetical protein